MGLYRDAESTEIDIVKEMAEGLGSTGLRLEEVLEQLAALGKKIDAVLIAPHNGDDVHDPIRDAKLRAWVRDYNMLVDKATDTRNWLLIQREACGFRKHRDVDRYYPIPPKMKLPKS
jgi:hypothetical protein